MACEYAFLTAPHGVLGFYEMGRHGKTTEMLI